MFSFYSFVRLATDSGLFSSVDTREDFDANISQLRANFASDPVFDDNLHYAFLIELQKK